jgi:hypothetical protein
MWSCLVLALGVLTACGGTDEEGEKLRSYEGKFECTEIDGDEAKLTWDQGKRTGTFGFIPANPPTRSYVTQPITALSFELVFRDVLGFDRRDVAETVTVRFDLTRAADGRMIAGNGTLVRATGTIETCTAAFEEEQI